MWKITDSIETYGIDRWGAGYFDINNRGHVIVRPHPDEYKEIDIMNVINELKNKRINTPVVLRFPQIIEDRITRINQAFNSSIQEYGYPETYQLIFPLKVNQRREVVSEVIRAGKKYNVGIEVGTKSELLAALSMDFGKKSLIICNGYKDDTYLRLAYYATELGIKIFIVVDELSEISRIIKMSKETKIKPLLGMRAKLYTKGSGKWAESGGEAAKYGLTSQELLDGLEILRKAKLISNLKLLHFHIGSQITEIKRIRRAVQEATRIYCKIKKLRVDIEFFNIGGGLGIDYDGSKTSSSSSANYSLQEYANNVVYQIQYICEDEDVECPTILSESGRAVVAYHAILVVDIIDRIPALPSKYYLELDGNEPHIIEELYNTLNELNVKNYHEHFHDALTYKDELIVMFELGQLSLVDKAKGEMLFTEILKKVSDFVSQTEEVPEDFERLWKLISKKYITNFSIFQSVPDNWAIGQLFPIMPLHKLNTEPSDFGTLADITCDSDGKIDRFIDLKDVKDVLEIHPLTKDPYYLGVFMVGAYQDTIGDYHNLLGAPNDSYIIVGEKGDWHIKKNVLGSTVGEVLVQVRFDRKEIERALSTLIKSATDNDKITRNKGKKVLASMMDSLNEYTYIKT